MSLGNKFRYNAIWACASILHVSTNDLPVLLEKMKEALVEGGVIYASFKYGDLEGERDGRYYTDMTSERFKTILNSVSGLIVCEEWYSEDVIKSRNSTWYNVILRKE